MESISIIILTKNEEQFIERCICSVNWADEVIVLDSGSTDKTKEIAAYLGAKIYENEWLGYSAQRNKALEYAKNDWVFFSRCR
jgi:(heptosyl)LPS beta-1,4-glucosyltransferase